VEIELLTNAVAPDRIGGLERYVRELATGLAAEKASVAIHAKRLDARFPAHEVAPDGVEIWRYGVPSRTSALFAVSNPVAVGLAGLRAARRRPTAVVHAHYPLPAVGLAARRRPYVYTFHAPVYRELLSERAESYALPRPLQGVAVDILRRAERLTVANASAVLVLSEFMRSELAKIDTRAALGARMVPGGVDLGHFTSIRPSLSRWRVNARPRLFCARRLTQRTGVRELVRAMPFVLAVLPRAELLIAGDGRLATEVAGLINELGLTGAVTMVGRVGEPDLRDLYASADVVVMPSQELEGFGLTTIEALACGTPVLGTPVGATPEILGALDRGLLTAGISPRAIADGVIGLCAHDDRLTRVRATARRRAMEFGWERVIERHLELYRAVATADHSTPRAC
jgi:glycosyltransferase involved in cell wall biosynthesis